MPNGSMMKPLRSAPAQFQGVVPSVVILVIIFGFGVGLFACTKISISQRVTSHDQNSSVPGVVRVYIRSDLNTLNPVLAALYVENYVDEAIFDGLVKLDAGGKAIPDLALAVPSKMNGGVSADGRTITYHLHRNVRWHDGRPFTASDVAFTYAMLRNPKVNAPISMPYDLVKSLRTPGPYTVVVQLSVPFALATTELFCNGYNGEIIPKHLLDQSADFNHDPFGRHPVGTGPFKFSRWDRGSEMLLERNDRYFAGAPLLKRIQVRIVPDTNTALSLVLSHELDVVQNIKPNELPRVRRTAGLRTELARGYDLTFVVFNMKKPPFDDVRVRRALASALDRERIAARAYNGTAIPADSLIPPYSWAYLRDGQAPRTDIAKANELLSSAGWVRGADGIRRKGDRRLSFSLLIFTGNSTASAIAQQMQGQWRAVGAEALIYPVPPNLMSGPTGPLVSGKFQVALNTYGNWPDPDRSLQLESRYFPPRGQNHARYSQPDVDRWSEAALSTYDVQKRAALYAAIQRRVNRDVPYLPIAWPRFIYAVNARLSGFAPETINSDFWNVQTWKM